MGSLEKYATLSEYKESIINDAEDKYPKVSLIVEVGNEVKFDRSKPVMKLKASDSPYLAGALNSLYEAKIIKSPKYVTKDEYNNNYMSYTKDHLKMGYDSSRDIGKLCPFQPLKKESYSIDFINAIDNAHRGGYSNFDGKTFIEIVAEDTGYLNVRSFAYYNNSWVSLYFHTTNGYGTDVTVDELLVISLVDNENSVSESYSKQTIETLISTQKSTPSFKKLWEYIKAQDAAQKSMEEPSK